MNLDELRDKLIDLNNKSQDIIQEAQAEGRDDLTDEENDQLESFDSEYKRIDRQIRNIERAQDRVADAAASSGRVTDPDDMVSAQDPQAISKAANQTAPARARIEFLESPEVRRNNGFKGLGDFAYCVKNAASPGGHVDPRLLRNAPTTVSTEGVGADGGFLVPPDYREAILEKVLGEDSILGRTDQMTTNSNTLIMPADETTPWDSSGGIQAYFESENGQMTQSKIALKEKTVKLNKLTALVPVTEELLGDASSIDAYLRKKVPEKFDFKLNLKLIQGTGAGEPLGILNSGCLTSVSKESGQSADTLQFENITNMWSRMYAPCRRNAVWMINQDIEPQLFTMSFEGTSSSVPAYMPANGLSASPYGTLMGRPVIPTEACKTLGDKGDIILCDWSQYLSAVKTGGVRTDVSIHLWFDYDTVCYRFIMRIGGQPWWATYITPRDSTNYLSCFVSLDERA